MVASWLPLVRPAKFMLEVEVGFKSRSLWHGREDNFEPVGPMTIGELASLSNLKPSAIRFYEKNWPAAGSNPSKRPQGLLAPSCPPPDPDRVRQRNRFLATRDPSLTPWISDDHNRRRPLAQAATFKIFFKLEANIAKARAMERMLRSVMKCRCTTIDQCPAGWRPASNAPR